MEQKPLFSLALGLTEPWFIDSIEFSAEQKRLDIHIDFKRGAAFPLPDSSGLFKVYDTVEKTWRHLNFFQYECYLHCRTPRVKTDSGSVRLVQPPWAGKSLGFTLLFEALLLQLLRAMPVVQVSRIAGVSDDKLWRLLEHYVDIARFQEDFSNVVSIGMDETSRCKGHDYITLFVDMEQRKTLYIAEGKDTTTVPCFLLDLMSHGGKPEQIERLCMDMSPAFIAAAQTYLPQAEVTFDKFHFMKLVNEAVNAVRKEEVCEEPLLRKARYVLLKNKENLTPKQLRHRELLDAQGFRLKSYRAMRMREYFQEAYKAEDEKTFRERIYRFYWWASHSRMEPMVKLAKTLRAHWRGVMNWFKCKENNGILEGLNSLIQAAKAKARGYKTTKNLKIIAYLLTSKLDFSTINPCMES